MEMHQIFNIQPKVFQKLNLILNTEAYGNLVREVYNILT